MNHMPITDSRSRVKALRKLLSEGDISTQEELVDELNRQNFDVTQSTISRDLRRIGAIKASDSTGRIVYRLPSDISIATPASASSLKGLLLDIQHNGSMIVLYTSPGSASLLARHLDQTKPEGILGTIAGDDTIFVVPASMKNITLTVQAIVAELS